MAVVPAIRPAAESDLGVLVEIEQEAFTDHWTAESFLQYSCTIAELEGQVAGFLVSREVFSGGNATPAEREILNLAVAPRFRRLGVAACLVRHELRHKASLYLEVRESNRAARALYGKLGFVEVSRRTGYYRHPPETAIVMKMNWC
jgi:ribosomal protein S18 acetylase RimI-like enzyme